jgi:putative transposase
VLLRLVYLSVTNMFALLRLLPASDLDKDAEILVLRHQVTVLQRQLGTTRPRFSPGDRAFLAALLQRLPRSMLGRIRLLVRPDTILRWHRDLLAHRHAARSRPRRPGLQASTVWEILRQAGIDPAPDRASTTWTSFLRSQADAPPATSSKPAP